MPTVLAILCSGRASGYTAGLLQAAADAVEDAGGEVDLVRLHDYQFKPCTSCFACIRDPSHRCVLDDDMGRRGKGELFQKALDANGILLADPVHLWGASAMCHLFFERLYPTVWSGELGGAPFMSISCATNQGMQHVAVQQICRWAFTKGMRCVGQLAVHAAHYDASIAEARAMAKSLAHDAAEDAKQRRPFDSDAERFFAYLDKPWNPLENYLHNLTAGTMKWKASLPHQAIQDGTFQNPEALELLHKADAGLRSALKAYRAKDVEQACRLLAECSSYWTHATWAEFLEQQAIGVEPPAAYRPLPDAPDPSPVPADPAAPAGMDHVTAYIDGASRGNPGPAACGVAVLNSYDQPVEHVGKCLGTNTNNYAEYQGLLVALERARELGAKRITIRADSQLLVRQMLGQYKVKAPQLKPLAQRAQERLREFDEWHFEHVPREENSEADGLANRALDRGRDFIEKA